MQNINHDWRSHFITLIKYIPSLAQPLHHGYLKLSCYCRLVENIWDHIWYSLVKLFFPFYFQGSKLAWKPKRWMDDCKLFNFRCSSRGGRKKTFCFMLFLWMLGKQRKRCWWGSIWWRIYVWKSRKRSWIEPRQYHFLYDHDSPMNCFPSHLSFSWKHD